MNFTDYKIAEVNDKSQIAERLAKVEDDLSKDIGSQVILIAYQRNEALENK